MVPGREYVQPQWVFDSFNIGCLLPIAPYAPGRSPPPHLSPFVDDDAEGYVPRQREILDRFAAEVTGGPLPVATEGDPAKVATVEEVTYDRFSAELEAEAKGMWHTEFKKAEKQKFDKLLEDDQVSEDEKPKLVSQEEEELLRRQVLMPRKHRRLFNAFDETKKKKVQGSLNLASKRKQAEKAEKEPKPDQGDAE